jgi:hypothetical protein
VAKALSLDSGWSARSIYERISARRDAERGDEPSGKES